MAPEAGNCSPARWPISRRKAGRINRGQLRYIHENKTAALLTASMSPRRRLLIPPSLAWKNPAPKPGR
jgi:hypothetical protein